MNTNKPQVEFTQQRLRELIKSLRTEYDLSYSQALDWIRSEYEGLLREYKQSAYYLDIRQKLELTDKDKNY